MGYLKKDEIVFQRDNEGKLLPVDVTLELYDNESQIKAIPLTRGELQELTATTTPENEKDMDKKIVMKNCIYPKFEENEEINAKVFNAIVTAIMAISLGVPQQKFAEQNTNQLLVDEEKNLSPMNQD